MGMSKHSLYKYVKTSKGWRYCRPAFASNNKIRPTWSSWMKRKRSTPRALTTSRLMADGSASASPQARHRGTSERKRAQCGPVAARCSESGKISSEQGTALRPGDKEPSPCMCSKCGVPLEFGDHSHDYVELLACPEHRKVDETSTAPRQTELGAERGVLRDKDGNRIVGFRLWCDIRASQHSRPERQSYPLPGCVRTAVASWS